jgi:hypothetical protein
MVTGQNAHSSVPIFRGRNIGSWSGCLPWTSKRRKRRSSPMSAGAPSIATSISFGCGWRPPAKSRRGFRAPLRSTSRTSGRDGCAGRWGAAARHPAPVPAAAPQRMRVSVQPSARKLVSSLVETAQDAARLSDLEPRGYRNIRRLRGLRRFTLGRAQRPSGVTSWASRKITPISA